MDKMNDSLLRILKSLRNPSSVRHEINLANPLEGETLEQEFLRVKEEIACRNKHKIISEILIPGILSDNLKQKKFITLSECIKQAVSLFEKAKQAGKFDELNCFSGDE